MKTSTLLRLTFPLLSIIFGYQLYADTLQVTSSITPQQMVQEILIGGGVTTSNITYTGASVARGKFWGGPGNIGIEEGILLTSGNVTVALGPDNAEGDGYDNNGGSDVDLVAISGQNINDACVLEFDFVPQSTVVSFKYVFASEEYHEYANSAYNDAFGFFISGPGINGPYSNNSANIALIPLTNIPVSINTVNCGNPYNCQTSCENCAYFVNNTQDFTEYDAFTTVLRAWANVIPCENYHIKLAVGDGTDGILDSGVFLEANSFSSVGIASAIEYTHEEYDNFTIEGCNDATITFTLSSMPQEDYYLPIIIAGTATNGEDYEEINDSVYFPAGYTMVPMDINTIADGIIEWPETVHLIYNSSLCGIDIDTAKVMIRDYRPMNMQTTPDTTINCNTSATIGVIDPGGFAPYEYIWSTGDTTAYITVNPLITTTYTVTIVALCDSVGTADITVDVNGPEANAGADQSIPHGTTTTLLGSASQGSGEYSYSWSPPELLVDPTIATPLTLQLEMTTVFTLVVTDLAGNCQDMDEVVVFITGGPLACNPIAQPDQICIGGSSQLLSYASGGFEVYTYQWTSDPPGFNSDLSNPVVQPVVTTTYYLVLDDGFNLADGSVTVTVLPLPVPEAGENDTIPHGTTTMLHGTATQGTGDFTWNWTPEDKLVNPHAQNPTTQKLYETTLFQLSVVDNETGCESQENDLVTVVINGGPLGVDAEATDPMICAGVTTQLHALGYGGNFPYYTYEWTSNPPGFTSTAAEPFVSPYVTTVYTVTIFDEFNYFTASTTVTVSDPPAFDLGSAIQACPYDSVTIQAPIPGMTYYWSNGSTGESIKLGTTGIGFDVRTIWLEVENQFGCSYLDSVMVVFDFSYCFGIDENESGVHLHLFPVPSEGILNLEASGLSGSSAVRIVGMHGEILLSEDLKISPDGMCTKQFDLGNLPDGIYLFQVFDQGKVFSRKFMLQ